MLELYGTGLERVLAVLAEMGTPGVAVRDALMTTASWRACS